MFTSPCNPNNRANRQRRIRAAVELLPDPATRAARILAIYEAATEQERSDGLAWYSEASNIAGIVSSGLGLSLESGAGIVAALSPQCSWDENIARALAFAEGDNPGGMGDGLAKARRIAEGEHPLSVLGGRKVRSFCHNIAGRLDHVTVDRHAVAIVYGRPLDDRELKILERIGPYSAIAGSYRSVARSLSIEPADLQAITWLAWRRIKRIGYGGEDLDF